MIVTEQYVDEHPNVIFVYGDNLLHRGRGGAAVLRWHHQSYGFVTKRRPSWTDDAFYHPDEYRSVFDQELSRLLDQIRSHPDRIYLISKLGSGLANRYHIYEEIIRPALHQLQQDYPNVYLVY